MTYSKKYVAKALKHSRQQRRLKNNKNYQKNMKLIQERKQLDKKVAERVKKLKKLDQKQASELENKYKSTVKTAFKNYTRIQKEAAKGTRIRKDNNVPYQARESTMLMNSAIVTSTKTLLKKIKYNPLAIENAINSTALRRTLPSVPAVKAKSTGKIKPLWTTQTRAEKALYYRERKKLIKNWSIVTTAMGRFEDAMGLSHSGFDDSDQVIDYAYDLVEKEDIKDGKELYNRLIDRFGMNYN